MADIKYINQLEVGSVTYNIINIGEQLSCSTAAATAAKTVECDNFVLESGVKVDVLFTYANTATTPTLNINSTGAKNICVNGTSTSIDYSWAAGTMVQFVYDGNYWQVVSNSRVMSSGNTVPTSGVKGQIYFEV